MGKQTIGRRVRVSFPELGLHDRVAKVDTGAYHSSIHCHDIKEDDNGIMALIDGMDDYVHFDIQGAIKVRSMNVSEKRYIINTQIEIKGESFDTQLTLTNREKMKVPILLGRRTLRGRFIVDIDYSATAADPEKKL